MPIFEYEAIDKSGKKSRNKKEAINKESLIADLKKEGLYLLNIKEQKKTWWQRELSVGTGIDYQEIVIFSRQLATLIRAGVPIIQAIQILSEQTTNKRFRQILISVGESVNKGDLLSEALKQHRKVFQPIFIHMIRAGEESGTLDIVLERLAVFMEKDHNSKEKVKSALTYPITVSIIAVLVTIFLLVKVVPVFVQMFADFGATLPLPTRIILAISNFLVVRWYIMLLALIFTFILFSFLKQQGKGRYYLDYFKLKLPVFGKLFQKEAMARFTRTFSTLVRSAVPILNSINMVSDIVGNEVVKERLLAASNSLRQGESLAEPLKKSWVFPPLVVHMIKVGEETGALDEMLDKIADFYETDVANMVDRLKALIEPLMIVFLAVIVGTIILAVIMPMFTILNYIG